MDIADRAYMTQKNMCGSCVFLFDVVEILGITYTRGRKGGSKARKVATTRWQRSKLFKVLVQPWNLGLREFLA